MSNKILSGTLLSMFFNTDFPIANATEKITTCNIYDSSTFNIVCWTCVILVIIIMIISFGKNK